METVNVYKCFISSPGDCQEERSKCDEVIEKINKGLATHLNVNFRTIKWENNVLPDMGKNGQEIIDESIEKEDYDIFIGVMKYRFGTPTALAGSGTEHEFLKALEKKTKKANLKIMFFFSNEKIDPSKLDYNQYLRVKEFKKKLSQQGIYVDYLNTQEFEEKLEEKLEHFVKEISSSFQSSEKFEAVDLIRKKLEKDLESALKSYNDYTPTWIEPIISKSPKVPQNPSKNLVDRIEVFDIVNNPQDIIIKAPAEFGLTSFAHFLKLEAWKLGKTYVYIDCKMTKKHKIVNELKRIIEEEYKKNLENIDCILMDSVIFEESGVMGMLKNVSDYFKDIPIIVLNTIENNLLATTNEEDENIKIERDFSLYYLLPLRQSEIRRIVNEYSVCKSLEEDCDTILNKVTKDLEVLNIHRTPKNCITILKASTKTGMEYSPVNRTKLLDAILQIIFEEYEIPTYKSKKPDIKDCTFILGYFCELLIKKNDYEFTEEDFKRVLKIFCEENFIDIDLSYLYSVLIDNSILTRKYGTVFFKNAYWIFYFSAHRMNLNIEFREFIYENKKYIDFPEIMEFYTGIDRNKEDALILLSDDIKKTLEVVREKVQIEGDLNPYKSIAWNPDMNDLEKEEKIISENVLSSGLPDEVKDKYNDSHYNQIKPYNQVINNVMREYSFLVLMRQISATSRALRNSDFVKSSLKKEVLIDITNAWNEITKLLIVLSPILADRGSVAFEGARFELYEDDFNIADVGQKRFAVLLSIPKNVIDFFKDDIFSTKIGPLINDRALTESNTLLKHELMLLIASERPNKWHSVIDSYIVSLDKNSFFLSDIANMLRIQFDYYVTEVEDRRILSLLLHKCIAKHVFNKKNPDLGLINRARTLK